MRGILPIAEAARRHRRTALILPSGTIGEAALVNGIPLREVHRLKDVPAALSAGGRDDRRRARRLFPMPRIRRASAWRSPDDVSDRDSYILERIVRHHSTLLIGPQGVCTPLARRVPEWLPRMTDDEAFEVTRIQSAAGVLGDAIPVPERPFRTPHRDTSSAGLLGTARCHRPGEVTLARHGVLYLDDVHTLDFDVLREVHHATEADGIIHTFNGRKIEMPTGGHLIAATSHCACRNSRSRPCQCTRKDRLRHAETLDALRDLFDLTIDL